MKYEIVVGLEVHAELNTKTKIYCGCKNSFGSMVNSNCCPICTGMPGTLPTLNKSVVDYAVRMGYALHCSINNICKMDRKNYFYPDLPKAYQISQFDIPLCENGYIDAIVDEEGHTKRIGVTRIHIEEDAGKLIHSDDFAGSLVEMKNVNSFSATVRAIEYEAARQIEILENGGEIHQETRRWDDIAGKNILLRSKEDAQDYRYFPEPDLKTIYVEESRLAELKASIPELPNDKLLRLMKQYKLPYFDANLMAENPDKADYFEAVAALGKCQPKNISNWLLGDITRIINEKNLILADTKLSTEKLADMLAMIETGEISTTAGKTVLEEIIFSDKTAADVVEEKGLRQMNDTGALEQVVSDILAANPKVVEDYRGGKTNALGFLVGQCMRASKGKGNPNILREMLEKALNS